LKNSQGLILVYMGILSYRLGRIQQSEERFLEALKIGFSMYAVKTLGEIFLKQNRIKESFLCIHKAIEYLINKKKLILEILPLWVEKLLNRILCKIGMNNFEDYLIEFAMEDLTFIKRYINDARKNKLPGWNK